MTPLVKHQVQDIEDTLRLVSNMINAPKRDTCLSRMVMKCWHWVYDALHDVPIDKTFENSLDYMLHKGKTPYDTSQAVNGGREAVMKTDMLLSQQASDYAEKCLQYRDDPNTPYWVKFAIYSAYLKGIEDTTGIKIQSDNVEEHF